MGTKTLLLSSKQPLPKPFKTPNLKKQRPNPKPFLISMSTNKQDLISKTLSENPSQIEPLFLVRDQFLTLRDKQTPTNPPAFTIPNLINHFLSHSSTNKAKIEKDRKIYLKDILREFKGQMYVPEEVFRENLSEEEEFEREMRELPLMGFEDFRKHVRAGKVRRLTSRSVVGADFGFRDFVVDLEGMGGEERLGKIRW